MRITALLLAILGSSVALPPVSQTASAAYEPIGHPDLEIQLHQPSFVPIQIESEEDYDSLVQDVERVPSLINSTILPRVKEALLEHQDELIGKYIQRVAATYDMNQSLIRITIETSSMVPYKQLEIEGISPAPESNMSFITSIGLSMPIYYNSTSVPIYETVVHRMNTLVPLETRVLVDFAREVLTAHKELLSGQDEEAGSDAINVISLKMLDRDIARVTVFHPRADLFSSSVMIDEIMQRAAVYNEQVGDLCGMVRRG